ncbi:tRNA lysidine(34) synthetase TilS [Geminicoccus flavidas]|uniref:tRNA lysidine(34) synthetase TilS n=1 Tax=Geminicoccus flavidas TaxID=2506407 RepID=UPI001358BF1B|nr:tRNA lysidine(34) synthetase TilS [Geminicoccus flavidas]
MAGLGPFEPQPRIGVALSGGADSVCLTLLAQDWTGAQGGEFHAFLVDHRLRADSAAEAALTAERMAARGVAVTVLRWHHGAIDSRIQERARQARYAMLEEAVAGWGGLHLLLGHHADDQAETVAMRRARGSGGVGLSGMAAIVERPQLRLLRPLLAWPKRSLLDWLGRAGVAWAEDPSNADPRFARARLRAQAAAPGQAPDPSVRQARAAAAALFLARHAEPDPARRLRFPRVAFRTLPADTACHLLGTVLAALAERPYPPRARSLARLQAALAGLDDGAMTLGGCLVRFGPRWVRLCPERPLPLPWRPPVPLAPAPFAAAASPAPDRAAAD